MCRGVMGRVLSAIVEETMYPSEFTDSVGVQTASQKRFVRVAVPDAPATAGRWLGFLEDVHRAAHDLDGDDLRVFPVLVSRPTPDDLARELAFVNPATVVVGNDTETFLRVVGSPAFKSSVPGYMCIGACAAKPGAGCTSETWKRAAANVRTLVVMNPDYVTARANDVERAAAVLVALHHGLDETHELVPESVDPHTGRVDGPEPHESKSKEVVRVTLDELSAATRAHNVESARHALCLARPV